MTYVQVDPAPDVTVGVQSPAEVTVTTQDAPVVGVAAEVGAPVSVTSTTGSGVVEGPQGPMGPTGPAGPQGPAGAKGDKGETGDPGPKGETGATGATGAKGDTGTAGATGPKGDKGEQGDIGPQGIRGLQGPVGDQGPQGLQGTIGPQGIPGVQGEPGPAGPKGDKGDTGPAGPVGPAGHDGTNLYPDPSFELGGTGLVPSARWEIIESPNARHGAHVLRTLNVGDAGAFGQPEEYLLAGRGDTFYCEYYVMRTSASQTGSVSVRTQRITESGSPNTSTVAPHSLDGLTLNVWHKISGLYTIPDARGGIRIYPYGTINAAGVLVDSVRVQDMSAIQAMIDAAL